MASLPRDHPADGATVPLTLLAEVLRSVAGALHDRPVQSLVAGRLLVETGLGPGPHEEVLARGLAAVTRAADLTRDLMWALDGVALRPSYLAQDIAEAVSRLAGPDTDVAVTVSLQADPDEAVVAAATVLAQAVHELLVDVLLGGGHAQALRVVEDAEGLEATVVTTGGSEDGPWVRLATTRLATAGGTAHTSRTDGIRTVHLTLPLPEA